MKNLDLYTLIVLASIVLIPAGGVWIWLKTERIKVGEAAIEQATRGGLLEKIGLLQKELDSIKKNLGQNRATSHTLYFEDKIMTSAGQGDLRPTDFQIGDERPSTLRKSHTVDHEVKIEFERDRKQLPLTRDFLHAMLFNCEMEGIWKLRNLDLQNAEAGSAVGAKPPPKTVADNWLVKDLVFARRAPEPGK